MRFLTIAALAAATPVAALAQGFSGAELTIETLAFSEDSDLGYTTYSGGLEFSLTPAIGLALDASYYGFSALDTEARNLTLHGIYNLSDTTSAGLFFGRDTLEGSDADLIGLEAGTEFMGGTVEGWLGQLDGGTDAKLLAVSGGFGLTETITATGGLGLVDLDGETLSRISLGGDYALGAGPTLYAEVGQIALEDADETYLSIGARVAIGEPRGTTFGRRSLFEIIPGF